MRYLQMADEKHDLKLEPLPVNFKPQTFEALTLTPQGFIDLSKDNWKIQELEEDARQLRDELKKIRDELKEHYKLVELRLQRIEAKKAGKARDKALLVKYLVTRLSDNKGSIGDFLDQEDIDEYKAKYELGHTAVRS